MLDSPKSYAAFVIYGDSVNLKNISDSLNIHPDFFKKPSVTEDGDPVPGLWQINSSIEPELGLEEHLLDILKKLAPKRQELKDILKTEEAVFYCSVDMASDSIDGIMIQPKVLTLIGNLGVPIEIYRWENKGLNDTGISII